MSTPRKIKIAIVGLNFGRHILADITKNQTNILELAAVCDMDAKLLETFTKQYNVKGYTSLDELLKDPEVEVVGLYTGPVNRSALIRKIIHAGKDVMTTKPFELDAAEAEKILKEAQAMGRIVHLNSPSPIPCDDMQEILNWVKKHDLGRPVGCRAEVWASYFEKADGTWYDDPQRCPMPPIFRLGIYQINDMLQVLGDVEAVNIFGSRIRTGRPTVDNAQLGILFKNGAIGNIYASFCVEDGDHYTNGLTINFERGTIYRNVGLRRDTKSGGSDVGLIKMVDGVRTIVEQKILHVHSGAYLWDYFHKAIIERINITDDYIQHIVSGVRVVRLMIDAQNATLGK